LFLFQHRSTLRIATSGIDLNYQYGFSALKHRQLAAGARFSGQKNNRSAHQHAALHILVTANTPKEVQYFRVERIHRDVYWLARALLMHYTVTRSIRFA
jgi:hypothetical protein